MSRADELKRFLSNARHPGEGWQRYRRRRAEANEAVRAQLRGRLVHESTRTMLVERDEVPTEAILQGKIVRAGSEFTTKGGKVIVPLRTKGVTFRRPALGTRTR